MEKNSPRQWRYLATHSCGAPEHFKRQNMNEMFPYFFFSKSSNGKRIGYLGKTRAAPVLSKKGVMTLDLCLLVLLVRLFGTPFRFVPHLLIDFTKIKAKLSEMITEAPCYYFTKIPPLTRRARCQ